jgi:CDP-diacylglycerol--glycerol-3-phosphate 3-phosphatidyltransferase
MSNLKNFLFDKSKFSYWPIFFTSSRLFLIIPFLYFLNLRSFITIILFLISIFSDFLDGFLARRLNSVTNFGKIFDPFVDKIFIGAILIFFSISGFFRWPVSILFIIKEFFLIFFAIVLIFSKKRFAVQSNLIGKICGVGIYFLVFLKILDFIFILNFSGNKIFNFFYYLLFIVLLIYPIFGYKKNLKF